MKKSINRAIRVKFATFDELNIERFFCKSRDLFYLFQSDSVKVDGKEVPKGERSKITLWQNKYIEECVVSKTNGGYTITENDYIEYELLECNNLFDELKKYPPLYADLKLKKPLTKYH
ncbi:MAG: hypothetical protein PHW83_10550 [Bacteroidales bacterium]|nr:hypothetical protein [Bacteroidales bacterium]